MTTFSESGSGPAFPEGHYSAGDVLVVRVASHGIGDSLLAMAAVAGLRLKFPERRIYFAGKKAPARWAAIFTDATAVVDMDAPLRGEVCDIYDSYAEELRGGRPRPELYAEAAGCELSWPHFHVPEYALEWARQYAGRTCLTPYAAWSYRTWAHAKWRRLEALLLDAGHQVIVLDSSAEGRDFGGFRSPVLLDLEPAQVFGIFLLARAACCNDSGAAHMAALAACPTFVVCGTGVVTGAQVFQWYPTVTAVQAANLEMVQPEHVLARIQGVA